MFCFKVRISPTSNTTFVQLYNGTYRVKAINYNNYTICLVDPGIQEGNCSSLPHYLLSRSNFTDTYNDSIDYYYSPDPYLATMFYMQLTFDHVVYVKCRDPVRDNAWYVDTSPCLDWESRGGGYVYAVVGDLSASQLKSGCHVKWVATMAIGRESMVGGGGRMTRTSYSEIHSVISYGFEVTWWQGACVDFKCPTDQTCYFDRETYNLGCFQLFHQCDSPMGITSREACSKSLCLSCFN